ncbi:MAG: hypothetical protein KatS3mg110_1431 [Pirellulaceae bacterium]|nr:MAG: hypothetical protein KatS3mg110_1431 [Pirellulaceae bacterium]
MACLGDRSRKLFVLIIVVPVELRVPVTGESVTCRAQSGCKVVREQGVNIAAGGGG